MAAMTSSDWTAIGTILLAIATFAAVVATVAITKQDRRNARTQVEAERTAADERLQRQIAASDAQLEAERKAANERLQRQLDASAAQLQDERDAAREQEQLAE